MGYSPRGRKESDTTERLNFNFLTLVSSSVSLPSMSASEQTPPHKDHEKTLVITGNVFPLFLAYSEILGICSLPFSDQCQRQTDQ